MARKERIFVSYRRSDALTMTGRLHDRLCTVFGPAAVFKDMEDIPAGADFRRVLEESLSVCPVVLAIIGPKWLDITDAVGQRRLEDPNDFVRAEVEAGLAYDNVLLIPVLIEGAAMPRADQLPVSIRELAYRNAVVVRDDPDFSHDMDQLCERVRAQLRLGPSVPTSRLQYSLSPPSHSLCSLP